MAISLSIVLKIGKPIFFILKYVYLWTEKKLLLPLLKRSHESFLQHNQPFTDWKDVGNLFEYCLDIKDIFSNEANPVSKIYIRKIHPKKIERLELYLEFSNETLAYQERIVIYDLLDKILEIKLNQIPIQHITLTNGQSYFAYDKICFKIINLLLENHDSEDSKAGLWEGFTYYSYLSLNNFSNCNWIYKWGQFWNTNLYTCSAKRSFKISIIHSILSPLDQLDLFFQRNQTRSIKIKFVEFLMQDNFLIKVIWLLLILRISRVNENEELVSSIPLFKVKPFQYIFFNRIQNFEFNE